MTHSMRTCGLDLGDKHSVVCVLDAVSGEIIEESKVRSTETAFQQYFERAEVMHVALETGTHSPWASRVIAACGHKVTVANANRVRLIHASKRKNDRLDAEKLARLARYDARLLGPIEHRSGDHQADLSVIRGRDALVRSRTLLINSTRGVVKSYGQRLPTCNSSKFHTAVADSVPLELAPVILPTLTVIASLNEQIEVVTRRIKELCETTYPETEVLMQVHGVAHITALAFVLVLDNHERFKDSRAVGAFLGLTPGQKQSGQMNIRKRISKEGDELLRRLLVQCAHKVLARNAPDTDLKRYGEKIVRQGGKAAKRRAVIAVARKLAVLLHRLWATGEVYEPLKNSKTQKAVVATAEELTMATA